MSERVLRLKISDEVYKKFKIICVEKDLSITKQAEQIISNFVSIQEDNKKLMMNLDR